jgi:hypothetical protein
MSEPEHRPHHLAIGTMFRDEARFLREWIEYHLMVGVDHFFLLQNDDPTADEYRAARDVLEPYCRLGLVTLALHADRTPDWQLLGWERLLRRYGPLCDWMAFIDLDVFMVPMKGDSVVAIVDLCDRPAVAGLAAHYCTFGDSGLAETPALQIESFVRRAPLDAAPNWSVNYIVRPGRIARVTAQGCNMPVDGCAIVNTDWEVVPPNSGKRKGPMDVLRLNHYSVRSRADWERKVARGWPEAAAQWTDPNHAHRDHKLAMLNRNDEHDASMHRFLPALKERLAR